MKSTYFGLLAEFGVANIPLGDCCNKYFGLSLPQAKRKAAVQGLPIIVFKTRNSDKCEYFIDAADLAEHIDKQKAEAKKIHDAFNQGLRAAS